MGNQKAQVEEGEHIQWARKRTKSRTMVFRMFFDATQKCNVLYIIFIFK